MCEALGGGAGRGTAVVHGLGGMGKYPAGGRIRQAAPERLLGRTLAECQRRDVAQASVLRVAERISAGPITRRTTGGCW